MSRCRTNFEGAKVADARNVLLHNAWAIDPDGSIVVHGPTHVWGPPPTVNDLNQHAKEVSELVAELNHDRLHGFVRKICKDAD